MDLRAECSSLFQRNGRQAVDLSAGVSLAKGQSEGPAHAVGTMSGCPAIAHFPANIIVISTLFGLLHLVCSGAWVIFGQGLRRLARHARPVGPFNDTMRHPLLARSLAPVLAAKL